MKLYEDFQRFNVFRRPDWRFERVLKIVDRLPTPGRCTRRDDGHVRAARNFLLRWRARETDDEREELFWENPGLYYAYQIYEKTEEEPEPAMILQARLLADQTSRQIADSLSTTPEAVDWYERLFFNVRDRLRHRDWITKHVLLPALMNNHKLTPQSPGDNAGLPFRDSTVARPFLDASLKLFAYFGGTHLVDVMITGFQSGKPLTSPEDMANWFDHHWSMTIRRRSHQAAMQFEINKYNVMELFGVHTQIMALERSEDSQEVQRTATEKHIKALLDDLPFGVGDDGAEIVRGQPLEAYDAQAYELRDDELMRVQHGAAFEDGDALKALPPPRKRRVALEATSRHILDNPATAGEEEEAP